MRVAAAATIDFSQSRSAAIACSPCFLNASSSTFCERRQAELIEVLMLLLILAELGEHLPMLLDRVALLLHIR